MRGHFSLFNKWQYTFTLNTNMTDYHSVRHTTMTIMILWYIKKLLISCKYRRSFDLSKDIECQLFVRNVPFKFLKVNTITFATRELSDDFHDIILFILFLSWRLLWWIWQVFICFVKLYNVIKHAYKIWLIKMKDDEIYKLECYFPILKNHNFFLV